MKYLILLLLLLGCNSKEEPKINLSSCRNIAKMLDGSFAYEPNSNHPCVVYIEGSEYTFYSDYQEQGIFLGLAMAVNRPKLKEYKKCTLLGQSDNSTAEKIMLVAEKCRKKLGMKEWY